MTDPLIAVAHLMGVKPMTALATLVIVSAGLNLLGRAIPDDAKGPLGIVRKIAKTGGLYLSNRISTGVSINRAVRENVETIESLPAVVEEHAESVAKQVVTEQVRKVGRKAARTVGQLKD